MKPEDLVNPRLYVDLDGVLADFTKNFGRYDNDINKLASSSPDDIYDYYAELSPLSDGEKLVGYLQHAGIPFVILTAPIRSSEKNGIRGTLACKEAKIDWVTKHLGPEYAKSMIVDNRKYRFAKNGNTPNILIDDMITNTKPWKQHGGISILYKNYHDTIAKLNEIIAHLSKNA